MSETRATVQWDNLYSQYVLNVDDGSVIETKAFDLVSPSPVIRQKIDRGYRGRLTGIPSEYSGIGNREIKFAPVMGEFVFIDNGEAVETWPERISLSVRDGKHVVKL